MAQVLQLLPIDKNAALGEFTAARFVVRFVCPCGHERDVGNLYIQRRIGITTTIAQLEARLRCSQCGKRSGGVQVFKQPR